MHLLLENRTMQTKKSKIILNQITSSKFIIHLVSQKIPSKRKEEKDMLLRILMILRKIMNLSHRLPPIVYCIKKKKLKRRRMTRSLQAHSVEMGFWSTTMTIEQQIQTRKILTTTKVRRTLVTAHQ